MATGSSSDALVRFDNVSKTYKAGNVKALIDVNASIRPGEWVFVVGSSGSGKSTFLKLLMREEPATQGHVMLDGIDLSEIHQNQIHHVRRRIGCVFQDFRLLPSKTIYENVAFALVVTGHTPDEIQRRVPATLELVGLGDKQKAFPEELSGGQQQRASIARAVINRPQLLVADEPTGNLDPNTSVEIMKLLSRINRAGTTVVMATHEKRIVDQMRRRVIQISQGRIVRDEVGVYEPTGAVPAVR